MTTVRINVDKARNIQRATETAVQIADKFYGVAPGDSRPYHLEQVDARHEQQVVTVMSGEQIPVGQITFYVEFVARSLS